VTERAQETSTIAPLEPLGPRGLLAYWLPLAAMWLLMSAENPLVSAFITRLPEATLSLAEYGVASSVGVILESPIIMLLTAGNALARSYGAYRRLLAFMHVMAVALTSIHLLIGLTGLYPFIVGTVVGAPPEVVEGSRRSFLIMAPWAAAVGYRRLWQGVLIRHRHTRVVPLAMVVRIVSIASLMLLAPLVFPRLTGAEAGALALTVGVVVSAVVAGASARVLVVAPMARAESGEGRPGPAEGAAASGDGLSWKEFLSFYVPLSLTSVISLAMAPVTTLGVSRALYPLESLAVWPVVSGLVSLFRSTAFSLQETTVGLLQDWRNRERLGRFAAGVAATLGGLYAVLAITPLRDVWFRDVAGLSAELARFTAAPALVLLASPLLAGVAAFSTGVLVVRKRPAAVTIGVVVNFVVLATGLVLLNVWARIPGTLLAAISVIAALAAQTAYLALAARRELVRPEAPGSVAG
jgi:progressive ankylosis protein